MRNNYKLAAELILEGNFSELKVFQKERFSVKKIDFFKLYFSFKRELLFVSINKHTFSKFGWRKDLVASRAFC